MTIAILGHYGFGNLGDDGVVAIVLRRIRDSFPDAEVYGICLNPKDTEQRHGLRSFPIRRGSMWPPQASLSGTRSARLARLLRLPAPLKALVREVTFLSRSFAFLRGFDLLVVPGSGQLNDFWGGPWRHPYTLLSWALMARLRGSKVLVLSVGAGQLTTRLGKLFCRWFLESTDYCSSSSSTRSPSGTATSARRTATSGFPRSSSS